MSQPAHIIIVEDDPITRRRLAAYLRQQHYRVDEAESALQLDTLLKREPVELLLVDINLDGKDGLEITREQRAVSDVGIILLTSRQEQVDRIVGLELGADDYITKPFDQREVLARVKNLIKRVVAGRSVATEPRETLTFGGWHLDLASRSLHDSDGKEIALTSAEFNVLKYMAAHANVVLSRGRLMQALSHRDWEADDRTVDVLIARLRRKFGKQPPAKISTIYGEGYLFSPLAPR